MTTKGRKQSTKPCVLLITRNLPPLIGGMERLNWHIADQLSSYAQVHILGPSGARDVAPASTTVCEVALRPLWRFLVTAGLRGIAAAWRLRPQVILAGSGLTAPLVWTAAHASGAKAAVYLHGLDIVVDHPLYRLAWLPAIRRMDYVVVNSRATKRLARAAGIADSRIHIVPPGVALPDVLPTPDATAEFRKAHALGDGPILLSVGRLTARKGLVEFVRDVLPSVAAARPGVRLVIVGETPSAALHADPQTPEVIQGTAMEHGLADSLCFLGKISDHELATVFHVADVHVFPVQEKPGDPEGFGMVAVEAAAHGLPTVAYATGGIVDAVADGESGFLIAPGDTAGMAEAIECVLSTPLPTDAIVNQARRFAWPRIGARLSETLNV